jgi:hypothetical protein
MPQLSPTDGTVAVLGYDDVGNPFRIILSCMLFVPFILFDIRILP